MANTPPRCLLSKILNNARITAPQKEILGSITDKYAPSLKKAAGTLQQLQASAASAVVTSKSNSPDFGTLPSVQDLALPSRSSGHMQNPCSFAFIRGCSGSSLRTVARSAKVAFA